MIRVENATVDHDASLPTHKQVLYMLFLQFLMFQNHKSIMNILYWFDPKLEHFHINMDKVG